MRDVGDFIVGFGCGLSVAAIIFAAVSTGFVPKSEVIKHGAAYHHPATGEFTWREPLRQENEPHSR